jgi:sterol desaturase/sphingolipid hydroxylase (fatty acid hydroxylase superfamily)
MPAMNLTTPALLFPAISLLLLAYTNRFMVLASLIRHLQGQAKEHRHDVFIRQMLNLRRRITLIRNMQMLGVSSFILCAIAMFLVFVEVIFIGQLVFGASIFLLVLSLILSLWEIAISTKAIEIALEDMAQNLES